MLGFFKEKKDVYNAALAFKECLGGDDRTSYQLKVMQYLAHYCGADRTVFHQDARVHAYNEGKRAVFLEINRMLAIAKGGFDERGGDTGADSTGDGDIFNPDGD